VKHLARQQTLQSDALSYCIIVSVTVFLLLVYTYTLHYWRNTCAWISSPVILTESIHFPILGLSLEELYLSSIIPPRLKQVARSLSSYNVLHRVISLVYRMLLLLLTALSNSHLTLAPRMKTTGPNRVIYRRIQT
jgi:hypothetical protein